MANHLTHCVPWVSILKSGGQPDAKGVLETTMSIQMTKTRPNTAIYQGSHLERRRYFARGDVIDAGFGLVRFRLGCLSRVENLKELLGQL